MDRQRETNRLHNVSLSRDTEQLSEKAALVIHSILRSAVKKRSRASVILAGGNTPKRCYEILADMIHRYYYSNGAEGKAIAEGTDWFFGDERWVEATHPMSNEGMARKALLSAINAPEAKIHSWHAGKGHPVERATEYDRVLAEYFDRDSLSPDIAIMGMGPDGHTLSLFPDANIVFSENPQGKVPVSRDVLNLDRNAVAIHKPEEDEWRLTMTPRIPNRAETMIFLIHGSEKRSAFTRLKKNDDTLPASWLKGKETFYFITESLLER